MFLLFLFREILEVIRTHFEEIADRISHVSELIFLSSGLLLWIEPPRILIVLHDPLLCFLIAFRFLRLIDVDVQSFLGITPQSVIILPLCGNHGGAQPFYPLLLHGFELFLVRLNILEILFFGSLPICKDVLEYLIIGALRLNLGF